MLKQLIWNELTVERKTEVLQRPNVAETALLKAKVNDILETVKLKKDKALFAYTKQFDGVDLSALAVGPDEMSRAMQSVSPQVLEAFKCVIDRLQSYHQPQLASNYALEREGVICERLVVPIQRVGLYVPAGTAPLVSTILMLGVPSQMAKCPIRVLCVPPDKDGSIDPRLLVAAQCCGINQIFKLGGAQAIAAMAYGTETVPKVDKIFGPGNSWVTMAKMLVSLDPSGAMQDLPAGPSEVLVIADDKANPAFVAADLLSQAEHGEDSQVLLICLSETFAKEVNQCIEIQLKSLSRSPIAMKSLEESICLVVDNLDEAIAIANDYAPEHLIIQTRDPRQYLSEIYTAGSIFLGPWSPESVGDYASGTNHILPTAGFAKSTSGLSLQDFMRNMSVQEVSREGLATLQETIRILTGIEGLDAHQNAIDIRLRSDL